MSRSLMAPLVLASAALLAAPAARAGDLITVTAMDDEFTPAQRDKLRAAVALANRVLASPEFRARLGAMRDFAYSRDDGARVHQVLAGGTYAVRFEAVAQYAFNFFGVKRVSKMVASSGHGSGQITFNTLRMHEFEASDYAGTIVHEVSHIAGYSHRGNRATAANLRSVPYRLGDLVTELGARLPAPPTTSTTPTPTTGLTGSLGGATPPAPPGGAPTAPVQQRQR